MSFQANVSIVLLSWCGQKHSCARWHKDFHSLRTIKDYWEQMELETLSDYHYVDFKLTAGILSFPVGLVGLAVVCVRECMFGSVWGCVSMLLEVCKHFRAILNNYCLLLLGATSFGKAKFQLWKIYFLSDHAVQCFQLKIWNLKVLNMFCFFIIGHWQKQSYFLIKFIGFLCFLSSYKVEWFSVTKSA